MTALLKDTMMQQGVLGVIILALVFALTYMYRQFINALSTQADKCKVCQERSTATALALLTEHNKAMSDQRAKNERDLGDLYAAMHENTKQMCDAMERMNVRTTDATVALTAVVSKFSGMLEKMDGRA